MFPRIFALLSLSVALLIPVMAENRKPRVSQQAMQGYLNSLEAPRAENRRYLGVIALLSMTCLALAIGLAMTAPLKEKVPYFVEVEQATGRVDVSNQVAKAFEPNEASVRYFVGRWVVDTFTIDEASRSQRLPASYALLRGAATDQWRRLILEGEDPIGKLDANPTFRRNVEFVAPPQVVSDNSILVRVALVEGRRVVARKQISLRFALIPPETDADLLRNPIGLWLTDFGVVNESL